VATREETFVVREESKTWEPFKKSHCGIQAGAKREEGLLKVVKIKTD